MPRGIQIDKTTVRIFFSSRDEYNRTRPYFIDVDANDLSDVKHVEEHPILPLGETGCFDEHGVMPCSVYVEDGVYVLGYVGWQRCDAVPYRTTVGLAVASEDVWTKAYETLVSSVIGVTTIDFTDYVDDIVGAMYSEWCYDMTGRQYPIYNIPQVEDLHEDCCTCAPKVIKKDNGEIEMFYSYRHQIYKDDREYSYRIGRASLIGGDWFGTQSGIDVSDNKADWDYNMICYADVLKVNGRWVMLYNGNDYGKNGFGWAEADFI